MPDERDYGERSNHHKSKHKSHHHYKGNEHHIIKVQTIARQHSAKKLVESKRSKRPKSASQNRKGVKRIEFTDVNRLSKTHHAGAITLQKIARGNSGRKLAELRAKSSLHYDEQVRNKRKKSVGGHRMSQVEASAIQKGIADGTEPRKNARPNFHHEQRRPSQAQQQQQQQQQQRTGPSKGDQYLVDLDKEIADLEKGDESDSRDSGGRESGPRNSDEHHVVHKKGQGGGKTNPEDDFCVLGGCFCVCLAFYVLIVYIAAEESKFIAILFGVIIPLGLILMTFGWRQAKREGKQRIFLW